MPLKDPEARRAYHREYMRTWYENNKDKHLAAVKKVTARRRKEIRAMVLELKKNPCTDCGGSFPPECMDFDHLEGKKFAVSRAAGRKCSDETVLEEIAKCELVCANCHRIRTEARRKK